VSDRDLLSFPRQGEAGLGWKVGEVRGAMEIIRPQENDVARTRDGLRGTFGLMAAISLSLLGMSSLALLAAPTSLQP